MAWGWEREETLFLAVKTSVQPTSLARFPEMPGRGKHVSGGRVLFHCPLRFPTACQARCYGTASITVATVQERRFDLVTPQGLEVNSCFAKWRTFTLFLVASSDTEPQTVTNTEEPV